MRRVLKTMLSGGLTVALSASLCAGITLVPVNVKAATSSVSGTAVKTDVSFDGTWNGDYEKNYNEKAERRNNVVFRPQQKTTVTLEKFMYIEADVAVPAELVSKIKEGKSRLEFGGWVDFATNTPKEDEWYDENQGLYNQDDCWGSSVVYSNTKYTIFEGIDGKDNNTEADLVKNGSYYMVHVKSPVKANNEVTNLKATEVAFNISVNAVNIAYDGFLIYDNLKLSDKTGKSITSLDFEDKTDVLGIEANSNDNRMNTAYLDFNVSQTQFNNVFMEECKFDAKYISDEKDEESWRNTRATEHNMSIKKFFDSALKLKAGTQNVSALVYIPKANLDKAAIKNGLTINMNVNAAKRINVYDGWKDFDWDTVVGMNCNGETRIEKDASGKLQYSLATWENNGDNYKATEAKELQRVGDYYVIPVKNPVYLEKADSFKGMEANISIVGDGVDYTGTIGCDDVAITSSKKVVFFANFDDGTSCNTYASKADVNKPNKNDEGLVEWYDGMDAVNYLLSVGTASAQTKLNKASATIYTGKSMNFMASVTGTFSNVSYVIENTSIATISVNDKGVATVTGKKAGTTYLTATANGVTTKAKITVKAATLKLKKASATLKKGKTVAIKATATPTAKITYKSSNKRVATVNAKGVVRGLKKGTAKIMVKANGVAKTFKVKVK